MLTEYFYQTLLPSAFKFISPIRVHPRNPWLIAYWSRGALAAVFEQSRHRSNGIFLAKDAKETKAELC